MKKYIINNKEFSDLEDIDIDWLLENDSIEIVERLNVKDIVDKYREFLTEEQIKFIKNEERKD